MPNPWILDAREFEATSDLPQSGLFVNDAITDFLSRENTVRTIVLAPKGCGKTLLIKYKRKALEKSGFRLLPDEKYRLLPDQKLVDVPPRPRTAVRGFADYAYPKRLAILEYALANLDYLGRDQESWENIT